MSFSDEHGAELLQLFLESAQELVLTLNEEAIRLEQRGDASEALRTIRRLLHTLKGDSAACGLGNFSALAHQVEERLDRETEARSMAQIVIAAADGFAKMLHELGAAAVCTSSGDITQEGTAEQPGAKRVLRHYRLLAAADPQCAARDIPLQMLRRVLSELGEVVTIKATDDRIAAEIWSAAPANEIAMQCHIPFIIADVKLEPLTGAISQPRFAAGVAPMEAPASPALRIEAARVDALMDLAGEMVVAKLALQQAIGEFATRFPQDPLRARLSDAFAVHARILGELQKSVLKVRMVEVGRLFRRLPRVLRDAAQVSGKLAQLEVRGAGTELDRSVLDALAEPLLHLVRNAVDHGIETPEERREAGKPEHGTITLSAHQQAGQVVISISDDGRGIDCRRLRARAAESGMLPAAEAAQLSEAEAFSLIFEPGFSTADKVSSLSGRGIGMDVVKSVVERLSGSVRVESTVGTGCTFRLQVPLTLAILNALLFEAGGNLYGIPVSSVSEIVRIASPDVQFDRGYETIRLRGEDLRLVRLTPASATATFYAIAIAIGSTRFALAMDRPVTELELVMKGLRDQLVATEMVSGAAILGDGRVVTILNLTALLERAARLPGAEKTGDENLMPGASA